MAGVLVCNLDPNWRFGNLCVGHGLDLFAPNIDLEIWDAGRMTTEETLLPWPRFLRPEEFNKAAGDLPPTAPQAPSLVIFLCGLQSEPDWTRLQQALALFPSTAEKFVICAHYPAGKPPAGTPHHALLLLSESDPLKQFYMFRLVLEILQGNRDLLFPPRIKSTDIRVSFGLASSPQADRVVSIWQPLTEALLRRCDEILMSGEHSHALEDAKNVLEKLTDSAVDLTKKTEALQDSEPPVPEMKAPLFNDKDLASKIRKDRDDFYGGPDPETESQSLWKYLRSQYRKFDEARHARRSSLRSESEEVLKTFKSAISPSALGLGEDVVQWLKGVLIKLEKDSIKALHNEIGKCLGKLEEDVKSRISRNKVGHGASNTEFEMPRFKEDDDVDEAVKIACNSAERLPGLKWFLGALGISALLGLLPPLARWRGGGLPLFYEPLDFAWVGLFVTLLAVTMMMVALIRRGSLKEHLDDLMSKLQAALERHKEALEAVYRYLNLREGLSRLEWLSSVLKNRLAEMDIEILAAKALQRFLETQRNYSSGFPRVTDCQRFSVPDLDPFVSNWLTKAPQWIRGWLDTCEPSLVTVRDERLSGDPLKFQSRYFDEEISLVVKGVERD